MSWRWMFIMHSAESLSSVNVDLNQVLTRRSVLKDRSMLHVVAGKVNTVRTACLIAGKKSQCSNKSTDSKLVIPVSLTHLIVWWWSPNLSILRTSTYIETHISRMYQLAGHSWKIFRGVLCYRVVGKRWQSYYYWFYQRNPAVKKLLTPTNNLAPRWSMEMAAHRVDVESGVMQLSQLTSR